MKNELLQTLVDIQRQNQAWLKFLAMDKVRDFIADLEDWEKLLYESLNGERTTRELARKVSKARLTILRRLDRWKKLGLVTQGSQGKYDKLISLDLLGIDEPEVE